MVSNKLKPIEHAQTKLESGLSRFRRIEFYYYDLEDLVSKQLESRREKVDGKLTFLGTQHFEKSDGPIKTIVGVIAATDIITLIKDPKEPTKINEDVFDENVRVYKPNHRVNKAIVESALSDTNYEFFYLNNGITFLCEGSDYVPNTRNPVVTLVNAQIINGGQTSHSLFEANRGSEDKMRNVEVLVRVCVAKKGDPISEKISETSNSQIPVGTRDLHSNDRIQRKLRAEFLALGYYYESKPNEFIVKPANKRLNNELLGQLYMAYEMDMPSEAKDKKSLVFGDKYDEIFDEDKITAVKFLQLYKIYLPILKRKKEVQRIKRLKVKEQKEVEEKDSFVSWATFHILNAAKLIIENRIENIKSKYPTKLEIDDEIKKVYEHDIDLIVDEAIEYIGEVINIEKRTKTYSHGAFFKETRTNKTIQEHVSRKLS